MLISDPLDELLPLLALGQNKSVPDGQFKLLLDEPIETPVSSGSEVDSDTGVSPTTVELKTDCWLELFAEQKLFDTPIYPMDIDCQDNDGKDIPVNVSVRQNKDSALNSPIAKPIQGEHRVEKAKNPNSCPDPNSSSLVQLSDGCALLWTSHGSGASGYQILQPSESQLKASGVVFTADVVSNTKTKNNLLSQALKNITPTFFAVTQQNEMYQLIEEQIEAAFQNEVEVDVFMQSSWTAEFQQSEYQREHWFFDQRSNESAILYYRNYFQPSAGIASMFHLPMTGLSQTQHFVFNGTPYTVGELNAG
ncbi:MAG TPA: hypothetical protein DF774_08415 [Rheinheimera sp.]|uniref:hypothetical protein n=1 Tax=Rheinheimera sp. TaxID=1869214 RepID=UPI000EEDA0D0|nr:hypothetical protein [Rheinheimera sp.]HCU65768.1 hypothetical protein [Rheinheimera sp.]